MLLPCPIEGDPKGRPFFVPILHQIEPVALEYILRTRVDNNDFLVEDFRRKGAKSSHKQPDTEIIKFN